MRYLPSGKIVVDDLAELREIVEKNEIDLSLIDIKASGLKSLLSLFNKVYEINGSINDWDVSDITSLEDTFSSSKIQPDLSKWNVSNVQDMYATFSMSLFNGDISQWDVSKVENMGSMFYNSKFNGDISKWDVSKVKDAYWVFANSNFDGDISEWKFNKDINCHNIFYLNNSFINKYNNGNEIPNYSKEFLKWFEKNRDKIYEIHNELNNETKLELDDYLLSFNLQGVDK